MADPFLVREKELLKLNATLNSRCSSLDEEQSSYQPNGKTKSTKSRLGKGTKPSGQKIKAEKKKTQSIKLRMSYEKVDVKSFYEELSKNVLRLDLSTFETNEMAAERDDEWAEDEPSSSNSPENGYMDKRLIQDVGKCVKDVAERYPMVVVANDADVVNDENAFSNANPIEKFLNEFTVDSKKLNIDPSNAAGPFRRGKTEGGVTTEALLNGKDGTFSLIPNNMLKKNVSAEGLIKFLKAKVMILQQELELSHKENIKNLDNLAKSVEAQKKIEYFRDQMTNKNNQLKIQIQKFEDENADLSIKLKEKDVTQVSLRRELDEVKSKLKASTMSVTSLDNRLFKSQEDLEYLRKNFHTARDTEKELRSTMQHEQKFYENQLKMLQKQRTDLISAYKKQLLLLDNLKRQNTCLEHAKLLQIGEKEFARILDWSGDDRKLKI